VSCAQHNPKNWRPHLWVWVRLGIDWADGSAGAQV